MLSLAAPLPTVSLAASTPAPYNAGELITLTASVTPGTLKEIPQSYEFQVSTRAGGPWRDLASSSPAAVLTFRSPRDGFLYFQVIAKVLVDTDASYDQATFEPPTGFEDIVDLSAPGLDPDEVAFSPAAAVNDALLAFRAVAAAAPPAVGIEINNTPQNSDDIVLLDPPVPNPPNGLIYIQRIPARITLNNGAPGVYNLSVNPPGAVALPASVTFQNVGQSRDILITPQKVSARPHDVTITATSAAGAVAGTARMTVVSVYFNRTIRNADTPAAMPDRIPPRADTPIAVRVTPNLAASGQSVTLVIADQSAGGGVPAPRFGSVTIGGNPTQDITSTGMYHLSGVVQTAPTANAAALVQRPGAFFGIPHATVVHDAGQTGGGNAGRLDFVVQVAGQNTVESLGFSVAAIPEDMSLSLVRYIRAGATRGFVVRIAFQSDSGVIADLDAVNLSEVVEYVGGRGTLATFGARVRNSGYLRAVRVLGGTDTHTTLTASIAAPGGFVLGRQVHVFLDTRTGVVNIPVTNSGYVITRDVFLDPITRTFRLTMSKNGLKTVAKGFTSDAGAIVGGPVALNKVP